MSDEIPSDYVKDVADVTAKANSDQLVSSNQQWQRLLGATNVPAIAAVVAKLQNKVK